MHKRETVPSTRPDNQGSTVRELCVYALTMFLDDLQNNFKIRVCFSCLFLLHSANYIQTGIVVSF